ncbi:MAG: hypothetical protein OIN66_17125 [Candidatus Methanoperedens sp.]|nr:hypothetical protein [Candidatus Methanoperedens sp.]
MAEEINATILRKEGDEEQPKLTETSTKTKITINYKKAKKANQTYAQADSLGWVEKLNAIAGGKFKAWADLWKEGKYDEFADAVAAYQMEHGIAKKDIDGILGLQTWATIGGLGEAMAGIGRVYWEKEGHKSEETCYLATEERIKRGHKLATEKSFELPEDRTADIFNVILKSIPNRMLDVDSQYRGAGAAGALVYAGIGEFVSESDIWDGKLRPGATLQVWGYKNAYDLLQAGEIEEKGKKRRLTEADAGLQGTSFYGTSFVFVRYDSETNEKMRVRHYGETQWKSKSDYEVWIAANIKETPQEPVE